ncbi:MAG: ribbon-helix-helix protein, CopG family [Chloroflexi bacterium]|nr:ribbon-helix-helix protein, CopG family [Chloroflexota bacterium]
MSVSHKKPFQVYLYEEQLEALRLLSKKRGASIAELVRQSIDRFIEQAPLEEEPLWGIVGIGSSGIGDLSERHDVYLAEEEERDNRA